MELRNSLLRARNKHGLFSYSMVEVNKKLADSDTVPYSPIDIQGGSNMTGTDLCVNKPLLSRSYLNHLVHRMWPQRLLEYDSYQAFYAMKMK